MIRRWIEKQGLGMITGVASTLAVTAVLLAWSHWRGGRGVVPDRAVDLGGVEQGKLLSGDVPIHDVFGAPMTIQATWADCGCTDVRPSKTTLAPGETATLHVTFNSTGYHGDVAKHVYMLLSQFSDPVPILIHAHVYFPIVFDSSSVQLTATRFGDPPAEGTATLICDTTRSKAAPVIVEGHGAPLRVAVAPWRGAGGNLEIAAVSLRLDARDVQPGMGSAEVDFRVGDRTLPLAVSYRVLPAVTASPSAALIGTAAGDTTSVVLCLNPPNNSRQ